MSIKELILNPLILAWYFRSRAIKSIQEWLLEINYEVIKNGKKYNNSALCVKNEKGEHYPK